MRILAISYGILNVLFLIGNVFYSAYAAVQRLKKERISVIGVFAPGGGAAKPHILGGILSAVFARSASYSSFLFSLFSFRKVGKFCGSSVVSFNSDKFPVYP